MPKYNAIPTLKSEQYYNCIVYTNSTVIKADKIMKESSECQYYFPIHHHSNPHSMTTKSAKNHGFRDEKVAMDNSSISERKGEESGERRTQRMKKNQKKRAKRQYHTRINHP